MNPQTRQPRPIGWRDIYRREMMTKPRPTATSALQAIADLKIPKNEDMMAGQEQAYRAVEALFDTPPHIASAAPKPTIIDRTTAEGGKWAFANAPTVEVEVVHIMPAGQVVVIDTNTDAHVLSKYGCDWVGGQRLTPMQRKPREVFIFEDAKGVLGSTTYTSGKCAPELGRMVRFVEVLDDE